MRFKNMIDAINSRVDHKESESYKAGRLRTNVMAQWVRMLAANLKT